MKIKLLFFAILISFFACSNGNNETTANDGTAAETVVNPLSTITAQVGTPEYVEALADLVYNENAKKIDPKMATEYVKACEAFAQANPQDARSPEWLLKAAETARNINQHNRAIAIYDTVMEKFPNYAKAPQALFLKAFTIDDNMNRKDEAKALYEEFLNKYPEDDFAESAKFMLENLNKTDAEIIEEFEKKRKEGATQ